MKFKFSFETLLKHRKNLEDEAQRENAVAQENVRVCLQEIRDMYDSIELTRQQISERESEGGVQASWIQNAHRYINGVKFKIEKKREEARELMAVAEQAHDELIARQQDHKVLVKLRENKKKKFLKEKRKRETREQDDMILMRANRRKMA